MSESREAQLVHSFVSLADSLVNEYDVIDTLQTLVDQCATLFDATDCNIVLGADDAHLEVAAATSEECRGIGRLQLEAEQGPCIEAVTRRVVVSVVDPAEMVDRWPVFAEASVDAGYRSAHAIPMRLREQTIGSLNLFRDHDGALNDADATAAQALADVATISIIRERVIRDGDEVREQLQRALDSRVVIEQAKGFLAHRHELDTDSAYRLLRAHARSAQAPLSSIAEGVVQGTVVIPAR
ncbi:transcriptional regulator [Frigoribacterium sp. Leaf263]|uniref:ANTAR domain-containing protein n=1 Tax=Frigoribacterium sp. Leaf263 TaxID=1736313 RepID=UPI0006F50D4C|nr:ANTAR domain-containing protein [Frigoribacterium sp. Leaf263]KQO81572.1 transcriptional regulator [Frigoribacterium sp. Leaf263]